MNLIFLSGTIIFSYKKLRLIIKNKYESLLLPVFIASSLFFINIGQYANPYTLTCFLLVTADYFFLKIFLKKTSWFNVVLFSLFFTLGFYTNYVSGIYMMIVLTIFLIDCIKNKKINFYALYSLILISLLCFFQLFHFITNLNNFADLTPRPLIDSKSIIELFFIKIINQRFVSPGTLIISSIVFFLVIWQAIILFKKSNNNSKIFFILKGFQIFFPFLLVYFLHYFFSFHLVSRLFFLCLIGFFILCNVVLVSIKKSKLIISFIYLYLLLTLIYNFSVYKNAVETTPKFKKIAQELTKSCDDNSLYLINSSMFDYYPLLNYYIWDFDLPKKMRKNNNGLCVFKNTIVFDSETKMTVIDKSIDTSTKKKVFIIYLTKTISDIRINDYIKACNNTPSCKTYVVMFWQLKTDTFYL